MLAINYLSVYDRALLLQPLHSCMQSGMAVYDCMQSGAVTYVLLNTGSS